MTKDDILRMAREAGMDRKPADHNCRVDYFDVVTDSELERFAALVAAAERERWLQLIVDCDAVQAGGEPNERGLCDAIDNDGCHYQSAALAGWLEEARKAGVRPMLRLERLVGTAIQCDHAIRARGKT